MSLFVCLRNWKERVYEECGDTHKHNILKIIIIMERSNNNNNSNNNNLKPNTQKKVCKKREDIKEKEGELLERPLSLFFLLFSFWNEILSEGSVNISSLAHSLIHVNIQCHVRKYV